MNEIIFTKQLSENVKLIEFVNPHIAQKRKAGQFVILRLQEDGERIPLTIAESDAEKGTVTIIVQGVGRTTNELIQKEAGDTILNVVGPLGKATDIEQFGHCVVIGGGVGTAIAYPTAKALKQIGNQVDVIIGGRTKDLVILENEIRDFADNVYITTDDGSAGMKGLVTDKLKELTDAGKVDYVLAIGPIPMMRAVANATRDAEIKTVVSLNPVMLDGTGMCGGCRAIVGGKNVFVCVDGPEFDAHEVDFDTLTKRNRIYKEQEEHAANCFMRVAMP